MLNFTAKVRKNTIRPKKNIILEKAHRHERQGKMFWRICNNNSSKQGITLNEVSLTNPNGAVINVQGPTSAPNKGKRTFIVLKGTNALADGTSYTDTPSTEDEKATLFSEGQLVFSGTGSINRYRGSLGVDIKLNRNSTLSFYFTGDYCIDKEVDDYAEGTILKSYTKETGFRGWLGAGYEFAF